MTLPTVPRVDARRRSGGSSTERRTPPDVAPHRRRRATLVTFNRGAFERVPALTVTDWAT